MNFLENIDVNMNFLENIDIDTNFLENVDIDNGVLKNIDKVLYRLEFGILGHPHPPLSSVNTKQLLSTGIFKFSLCCTKGSSKPSIKFQKAQCVVELLE